MAVVVKIFKEGNPGLEIAKVGTISKERHPQNGNPEEVEL